MDSAALPAHGGGTAHEEIRTIITAIGTGVSENFTLDEARYHAQQPLFRVAKSKEEYYAYDEAGRDEYVKRLSNGDASQLFEMLMGDEVEPRRKFIEEHATFVRNLDV